jgi:hypothetical protein
VVDAGADGAVIGGEEVAAAAAFGDLFASHFAFADEFGGEAGRAAVFRCGAAENRHDAHRSVRNDEDLTAIFSWREFRKVTDSLTLSYERKLYVPRDTADNRRYIRKYVEVFQFPDGRIEIRVAGKSLPYRTYNKLRTWDHGKIVDNKRLSSILEAARKVQSRRDDRVVRRPSTAHRADGSPIPRNKIAGSKRQRDLSETDLHDAIKKTVHGQDLRNNAIFDPPKRTFLLGGKPDISI